MGGLCAAGKGLRPETRRGAPVDLCASHILGAAPIELVSRPSPRRCRILIQWVLTAFGQRYMSQVIARLHYSCTRCAREGELRYTSTVQPIRLLFTVSPIAFLLVLGTAAQADAINVNVNYSTSMVISDIGVSGAPAVSYQSFTGATVSTLATATYGAVLDPAPSGVGSALSLGAFTFKPNPAGVTTYDNTPFYLSVTVNSVNGNTQAANPSTYTLDGFFSGTVTATGAQGFSAIFVTSPSLPHTIPPGTFGSFSSGGYDTFLSIPYTSIGVSNPGGIPAGGSR